jgi:hypothetical protein
VPNTIALLEQWNIFNSRGQESVYLITDTTYLGFFLIGGCTHFLAISMACDMKLIFSNSVKLCSSNSILKIYYKIITSIKKQQNMSLFLNVVVFFPLWSMVCLVFIF